MYVRIYFWIACLVFPQLLWGQRATQLGPEINSLYEEREPIPSRDGRTLFFWRREMPQNEGGVMDPGDIWYSNRDRTGRWQPARRMAPPLNSKGHDFVWQVSPRMDTLWVTQVPPGIREGGMAYSVRNRQGLWSLPQPVNIRNFRYQGQYKDFFLTKQRFLLIPNEGVQTYGGTDLYVSFPINDTAWSQPINLGPTINTVGDEDAGFLSSDGKTLYFNSNGHGGLGDHDVFVSQRLDNTWRNWSTPVNVGAPINTPGYDFDFFITDDGNTLFWCSDHGSLGSNDIFSMPLNTCELTVYPEGPQTLCQGQHLTLEAGFTTGRVLRYQWLKNGSPIRGATDRSLGVRVSGDYQLVRMKDRCVDTSAVKQVRFVNAPLAELQSFSDVLCLDDSIQLQVRTDHGRRFQWQKNKLDIPDAEGARYWVKTPGQYRVKVSIGGCSSVSTSVNLRRFTPPGIFTAADTVNGLLPTLPRWLWTNKIPRRKGLSSIKDMAIGPNGNLFVLNTLDRRGRYFDYIDGFFPSGLHRVSFPSERLPDQHERYVVVDADGHVLVGDNEVYLTKYRPDGRVMWRKDVSRQQLTGLTVDPLGYIYTSGRFEDEMILSGKRFSAANRGGLFLAKHSPRGELMWVNVFAVDPFHEDFGNALHSDCEGNIYLSGGYDNIANFGDKVLRGSLREHTYFLTKFDPEGSLQWARRYLAPRTRPQTHDVHTDCQGNSFLVFNGMLFRVDAQGLTRWEGPLLTPAGSHTQRIRIHATEGDLYASGYTDRGEFFVSKFNRLNKQAIIWQGRGADTEPFARPAITGDEAGNIYVSGISRGAGFPGAQLDQTSGSTGFVLKYGRPDFRSKREPLSLCEGENTQLYTQAMAGLRYQWFRDGKAIPGANSSNLEVSVPGVYQVQASSDFCERLSLPQEITRCGEVPTPAPAPVSAPIVSLPPSPRSQPEPQRATEVQFDPRGVPRRLRKRRVKTQEEIVIYNTEATITLWDHAAEDQDTVSINVNGQWILQDYGLKKKRKEITYTFQPGNNYIMLYAHNLGAQPPNTASLTVDDGINRKTLVLRSNLKNCGMLKVRVN